MDLLFGDGEGFWTSLFEGLANVFLGPARDQLRQTLASLDNDAVPSLAADAFMQQYEMMWAVALLLAVPLLAVKLIQAFGSTGHGSLRDFAHLLFTVVVFGHLGVAVLFVIQTISGYLSELAMMTAGEGQDYSWFDKLVQLPVLSGGIGALLGFFQWNFNILLQLEAFVVENTIIVTGTLIVLGAVLGFAGKIGEGIRNVIFGLCAASLLSPPLMILVLVAGTRVAEAVDVPTLPVGYATFNVLVLGIAAYVPVFIYRFFVKKYVHVLNERSDSPANPRQQDGSPVFKTAALAAGGAAALMKVVNSQSPEQPRPKSTDAQTPPQSSTVRRIAYTALSSAGVQAAAKAHPYLAVGAQVAAFAVKPRNTSGTTRVPPSAPPKPPTQAPPTTHSPAPPTSPVQYHTKPAIRRQPPS